MGEHTRSGVIGRPSLATAEKGKAVLASLVDSFASVLTILQRGQAAVPSVLTGTSLHKVPRSQRMRAFLTRNLTRR